MILLDTSVLSRVFRRRQPGPEERRFQAALEGLIEAEAPLGLPGVVLQEVLSGIRGERQFAELRRRLLASFTIVLPTTRDHVEAARLRNKCLAGGLSASGPDCLIAALAIAGDHELFAADGDFVGLARQSPLKLYKWGRSSSAP